MPVSSPAERHPRLSALEAAAAGKGRLVVAVAYPCSNDALAAALTARDAGTIEPGHCHINELYCFFLEPCPEPPATIPAA